MSRAVHRRHAKRLHRKPLVEAVLAIPTGAVAWVGRFIMPTPVKTRVRKARG